MGNTAKKQFVMSSTDWESVPANYAGKHIQVWRNRKTGEELEEYRYVSQSPNDLKRLSNLYVFRQNHRYLVASKQFRDSTREDSKLPYQVISMFLQRIPRRLSQVEQIGFSDALHVYESCLNGFNTLFHKVGYFNIQEDMIGFSKEGRVKVWFQSDFSRDHPDALPSSYSKGEQNMVLQLLQILDKKVDQLAPENISRFLGNSSTFDEALVKLVILSKKHSTRIPERLHINFQNSSLINSSAVIDGNIGLKDFKSQLGSLIQDPIQASSVISTNSSKIKSIQTKTILAQGVSLDPRVPAHRQMSNIPILGPTPIGIRPLSPARIVIRAQSPIPRGQNALEIRPLTPPSGIHSSLHPLLLNAQLNIKSSFIHPKAASTLVRTFPPISHPTSVGLNQPPSQVQQQDLRSLQRRMQSELERVNSVIKNMQESNFNTTPNDTVPIKDNTPVAFIQRPPISAAPQSTQFSQIAAAPAQTLASIVNKSSQSYATTINPPSIQRVQNTAKETRQALQQPPRPQSLKTEPFAQTAQPKVETYIFKTEQISKKQQSPIKVVQDRPFSFNDKSALSSTIEGPKIFNLGTPNNEEIKTNQPQNRSQDRYIIQSRTFGLDTNQETGRTTGYPSNNQSSQSQTVNQSNNYKKQETKTSYNPITTESTSLKFDRNSNYIKVQARKVENY